MRGQAPGRAQRGGPLHGALQQDPAALPAHQHAHLHGKLPRERPADSAGKISGGEEGRAEQELCLRGEEGGEEVRREESRRRRRRLYQLFDLRNFSFC